MNLREHSQLGPIGESYRGLRQRRLEPHRERKLRDNESRNGAVIKQGGRRPHSYLVYDFTAPKALTARCSLENEPFETFMISLTE